MHWTAVEPSVANWLDSRKPCVTYWPGEWHVGTYASPDNWCTCLIMPKWYFVTVSKPHI